MAAWCQVATANFKQKNAGDATDRQVVVTIFGEAVLIMELPRRYATPPGRGAGSSSDHCQLQCAAHHDDDASVTSAARADCSLQSGAAVALPGGSVAQRTEAPFLEKVGFAARCSSLNYLLALFLRSNIRYTVD